MANEATLVLEKSLAYPMTWWNNATACEKGAILKISGSNTAALSDGDVDVVAGIAQSEHIASAGHAAVSVYKDGIFRVTVSGSVSAGDPVVTHSSTAGANYVKIADTNEENILGVMLEDGTDGQTKLMELRPTTMQLA